VKKVLLVLGFIALVLSLGGVAYAATTATQTVTYQVTEITAISASGNPAALIVSAAVAGSQPTAVTDATTTYSLTTNHPSGTFEKITAQITTGGAMPTGVTLEIQLAAPPVGTSAGYVALTASAQDVVTSITACVGSALTITYRLSATVAAGVVASAQKTITLTIVDA
jgi:hypothetical protein